MIKGKQTEDIIKKYLINCNYKVSPVMTKEGQMKQGDFIAYSTTGKKEIIEVKTSSSFNNIPKLSIDIYYLTKDNKNYYEQNTNGHKGWLYSNEDTTILMAYNYETNEIYQISNYQAFKKCVKLAVDIFFKTSKNTIPFIEEDYHAEGYSYFATRECKDRGHNIINEHLEISCNRKDKCKNTLIVSVPLNLESVSYLGGHLKIISVNSNLEHKKSPVIGSY